MRRYCSVINLLSLLAMPILGLFFALALPRWLPDPVNIAKDGAVVLTVGFLCLLAAKFSLFRRGIWMSWGPGHMPVGWSRLYKFAYVLMGIGALLTYLSYRVTR